MIQFHLLLNNLILSFFIAFLLLTQSYSFAATLSVNTQVTDSEGRTTFLITNNSIINLDFGKQNALCALPVTNGQCLRNSQHNVTKYIADIIFVIATSSSGIFQAVLQPSTAQSFNRISFVTGSNAINNEFNANPGVELQRIEPKTISQVSPGTDNTVTIPISISFEMFDNNATLQPRDNLSFIFGEN